MPKTPTHSQLNKQLAKAERELEIQDALDRIRSVALAMQTTEDIGPVVAETRDAMWGLGIKAYRTSIFIKDRKNDRLLGWSSKSTQKFHHGQHVLSEMEKAGKVQKPPRKRWTKERLNRRQVAAGFRKFGLSKEKVEQLTADTPTPFYHHQFYFSGGQIGVGMDRELEKDEIAIARRVTETFDFAYKRLVELQEKEAQNRELAIQNGLERVRAQALGMQVSDDLTSVTATLHEQMTSLGIQTVVTAIEVVDLKRGIHQNTAMLGSGEGMPWQTTDLDEYNTIAANRRWLDGFKRGDAFMSFELEGKACREHQAFWLEKTYELNPEAREIGWPEQSSMSVALAYFSRGWLFLELGSTIGEWGDPDFQINRGDLLSDDDLVMVKRFADVFDFAYGRFLELKEKEAQNRELTIQNALERVRSRALGMQESEEIRDVVWDLLEEARELDLPVFRTMIGILDCDESWIAHHYMGQAAGSVFVRPSRDSSAAEMIERWQSASGAEKWTVEDLTEDPARLKRAIQRKMKAAGISPDAIGSRAYPTGSVLHHRYFDRGVIGFDAERTLSEDELSALSRFVDVFAFAYNRFRELADKESQNRELTIQNALERVRARALGMQESDDLVSVSSALLDELKALGIPVAISSIGVRDVNDPDTFTVVPTQDSGPSFWFTITRDFWMSNRTLAEAMASWERGDSWFAKELKGREAKSFEKFWKDQGGLAFDRSNVTIATIWFARGWLYLDLASPGDDEEMVAADPLDDEQLAMIKRFADMFDFAYGRYLELKEKEDQNRELAIQNALERVRARALGMQESTDLREVTTVLFGAMLDLGFDVTRSAITIAEEVEEGIAIQMYQGTRRAEYRNRAIHWHDEILSGHELRKRQNRLNRGERQIWSKNPSKTSEAWAWREGKLKHLLTKRTYEEVQEWESDGPVAPDLTKRQLKAYFDLFKEGQHRPYFFFKYGWLSPVLTRPLTEEEVAVGERFAKAFEFAYERFLELQQKEAQNRELAVEAALERVRSRALAMESFDDLNGVAHALYEALEGLDYSILRSTINVFDRENATLSAWVALTGMMRSSDGQETVYDLGRQRDVGWLKGEDLPAPGEIRDRIVAWQRGDVSLHQVRESARAQEFLDFLHDSIQKTRPGLEEEIDWDRIPEVEHHCSIFNAYGWVQLVSEDPFSDAQTAIARRFVDLFAFAYSRFKELDAKQKANQELAVEAALERVRSRALGMEGTHELPAVASLIRQEVVGLGIEPVHLGIALRYESSSLIRQFRIDPDGSSHEITMDLDEADQHPSSKAVKAARAAGEPHCHMTLARIEVATWGDMVLTGQSPKPEDFPEIMEFYWFIFEHGALSLGLTQKLDEVGLTSMSRFGETFGFACDRYLQIEATERQNQQLRLDAALERVHANVASMQSTDDIGAMMGLVYREIEGLGIDLFSGNIIVVDEANRETRQYALIPQTLYEAGLSGEPEARDIVEGIDVFRGDRPIHQTGDEIYSVWKSGVGQIDTPPGSPDDRKRLVSALKTQFGLTVPEQALPRSVMRVPFSHGVLLFYASEVNAFSQDDLRAVSEFAEMVTLGYARYLDFQRLEEQNRELAEANERVVEATRMKSQFLATMSHELRTPMNAIVGFTQLVLRRGAEQLSDRHRGNLEKVKTSADHLLNLINDILDLSKVEAGRVEIQASDFELKPLLEQACSTVGPTLGKPGVEVRCEVDPGIGMLHTDEARLRQVVINLLSNACKFTDEGSVSLSAKRSAQGESLDTHPSDATRDGGAVIISVVDTGIGIPEDQLGTIFEEFRQVDGSSTRRHQGTGLGLAITKRLVELMGGLVSLSSTEGEGSKFVIEIPAVYGKGAEEQGAEGEDQGRVQSAEFGMQSLKAKASPDSRPATSDEGGPSIRPAGPTRDGGRVIVSIDDDPNVGVLLREMLEEDGYTVISALNADEGVALVRKHQPAAVTVDILMPGKDGWTTIGMLKEDPDTRDIPVVVVSGMANRELGFSMGVKDYVVKPFDQEAIVGALRRISVNGVKDILVVDDEPSACELVCEMLDETGYETRRAFNGKQALAEIEKHVPDAMFLDLMMPELDGFGVIEALQANEAWKAIPVIVVTAKDLTIAEEDYLKARVEKVVQKGSLDGDELRRLIK